MTERNRAAEGQAFWEKTYLAALSALIRTDSNAADRMRPIVTEAARAADIAKNDWNQRF